ncbi:TrlF family AAA-like ATPase, partial [Thiolapillus sp.]|uniref:TrlF family AAA-like ATPase n=1 Tax=Thiolapillus sp. TaxID=2017437 RepID=UPI003AF9DC15
MQQDWPWPGSCWWKFDFHTHTPASTDTPWARQDLQLSHEEWLLKFMAADIDCMAVTDHNSGEWIDPLKATYAEMKQQADNGNPPADFRELTLFPGMEISANGGVHVLAIFGPEATTSDIDSLRGAVGYTGTKGDSDGETNKSVAEVIAEVMRAGAIPIPAHADADKGLLRVNAGTQQCALSASTVKQALEVEGLLAVEWCDLNSVYPQAVKKLARPLARVVGSDRHSFQGDAVPGSRYTWIKMASPTIEGLRLALLDGNGISVRRSDEGDFEPFDTPAHFITGIEIENARFMGNGSPEHLSFAPYYNALIGGRGTGKSTVIHAMRLASRRDGDLQRLGEDSEPRRQFERFRKVVSGRDGEGALRDNTEICLEMMREGVAHRLRWRQDGSGVVVEEKGNDGQWTPSSSQTINAERFPIRLFSQGQIAAMAGDSRQALLDVIDETANIGEKHRAFEEAKRTWFAQQARLRELDGRLKERPELERKLADLVHKLEAFTQSHHADVLKSHQRALRQRREIDGALSQLQAMPGRIESLIQELLLDDWPDGIFDLVQDADILKWRSSAEQSLAEASKAIAGVAQGLMEKAQELNQDERLLQWRQRAEQAEANYKALQTTLAGQGVTDPQEFGHLVQQRQQLEGQIKALDQVQQDQERLQSESKAQFQRVLAARKAITEARKSFVTDTLETNEFVRMEVVPFGFDSRAIEQSLRELLDAQDDRFGNDILLFENGEPASGLAFELSVAADRDATLEQIKDRLIQNAAGFGGHFHN